MCIASNNRIQSVRFSVRRPGRARHEIIDVLRCCFVCEKKKVGPRVGSTTQPWLCTSVYYNLNEIVMENTGYITRIAVQRIPMQAASSTTRVYIYILCVHSRKNKKQKRHSDDYFSKASGRKKKNNDPVFFPSVGNTISDRTPESAEGVISEHIM